VGECWAKALGADTGISRSEVSRICACPGRAADRLPREAAGPHLLPYIYLDATYCKARVNHQIASRAVVIATGITEDGGREVLGVMVGDSETEAFWTEFLRHLRERRLSRVRVVLADHHIGLVNAFKSSKRERCVSGRRNRGHPESDHMAQSDCQLIRN
jgi:putative transposase